MRGAHVVRCDWKPEKGSEYSGPGFCRCDFRSFALLSVLHSQLVAAGWHVEGPKVKAGTKHLCPDHKPSRGFSMPAKRVESG